MKKRQEKNLEKLTKAAERENSQAMLTLGSMYYWGKGIEPDTEKAIFWLKRAADTGSHSACLNLAHVYYKLGDTEENNQLAWKYYYEAYMYDSKNALFLGRMIFDNRVDKIDNEQQRLDEAKDFFNEALAEGGVSEAGLYLWKIALLSGKSIDEADSYYLNGESLLESPKDYNNWAWLLCEWGEYEKALPYIEKSLSMEEQGKENPDHLDTYAECLSGLERKAEAEHAFREAIKGYQERDIRKLLRDTCEKVKACGFEIE
ncbi:MAG: SEL1-like repeat protein [Paludibacteraceae bacterium]|nr:SEL1-like repeat protein [Paludibacteraceae bacterium]